jgi:methionyl-tRNA formyltransferase
MHTQVDAPGTVIALDDEGMMVACGEGTVRLTVVHPAGKRRQTAREWAAGRGIAINDVLGAETETVA